MQTKTSLGIIISLITGFRYVIADTAEVHSGQIAKVEANPMHWLPIIGIMLLVGGVIIIVTNRRRHNLEE